LLLPLLLLLKKPPSSQPDGHTDQLLQTTLNQKTNKQQTNQHKNLTSGAEERSKNATSHSRATVSNGILLLAKPPSSHPGSLTSGNLNLQHDSQKRAKEDQKREASWLRQIPD
jgi:recombination DNA repair RAD52 pathway protein